MFGFPVSLDPDQLAGINTRLDAILAELKILNQTEGKSMSVLDDIEAEVAKSNTIEASIETLIGNMVQAVKNASTDPARLQAVLTALQNNDARLAQIVLDNTPQDPPNTPTPPPDTSGLPSN